MTRKLSWFLLFCKYTADDSLEQKIKTAITVRLIMWVAILTLYYRLCIK